MDESLRASTEARLRLREVCAEVMAIETVDETRQGLLPALRFRGHLLRDAQAAYDQVAPQFRAMGFTALLRQEGRQEALLAVPGAITPSRSRLWLALLLFGLTVLSTVFTYGADLADSDVFPYVHILGFRLFEGLEYGLSLLAILGAHELGHYIVARRAGVAVSFPFFIPLPLISPFGTMGAFIAMKEPPPNRRTLLSIAVAGPLAGLIIAIPVLFIGLRLSVVQAIPVDRPISMEGNSLLYAALKYAVFGRWLPMGCGEALTRGVSMASCQDVLLHPIASAGWAGLLVTALNLIPAGQLDGGHIFYALFGPKVAEWATIVVAAALVGLGFIWGGWFLWAILIAVFGRMRAAPFNEITELDRPRQVLALLGLLMFILVFTPTPLIILLPPS